MHKLQGRTEFQGLPISIENKKGSVRHWTDENTGEEGTTKFKYPYGYVKGTLGVDGDAVDIFLGPDQHSTKVFIITQLKKPEFKETDEQKVMLGFNDANEAKSSYLKHYDNPRFFGGLLEMSVEEFKEKLKTQKGKLIKSLKTGVFPAILYQGEKSMLLLSKAALNKSFKKSEEPGKTRLVDSESCDEDSDVSTMKSETLQALNRACSVLHEGKEELAKKSVELDDDDEEDTSKSIPGVISKALNARTSAGLSRRAQLDAWYQTGKVLGERSRQPKAEPVTVKLNIGNDRPISLYEPPSSPMRKVDLPLQEARAVGETHKSCQIHGYVHKSNTTCTLCDRAKIREATPIWKR